MPLFRTLNLLTLLLCFCVIVFGAYVRLSDAGLGCPDWPGCYGHLTVPSDEQHVAAANAAYPERPVEAHKGWKEMIHRYLASTLGLLIVALAVLSLRLRKQGVPRFLPWLLVAMVIFQGILGMWTVTWQLKPLVVTGHLLGGMTTFAMLLWLYWSSRAVAAAKPDTPTVSERAYRSERHASFAFQNDLRTDAADDVAAAPPRIRLFATLGLLLLVLQIFLGGWTSTNYAALACPDLPTCHGSFWPQTDIPTAYTLWHGLGINYEYGILDARARVTIHHFHRVGAVVVTVALLLLGISLLKRGQSRRWRLFGVAVIAALALQVTIGISVVFFQLPLLLAAAHNAGAAILLAVMISLNHAAWSRR